MPYKLPKIKIIIKMKEKIEYKEENAYNLLSRLIRVFPFKIEVDESLLNYYRDYQVIDPMAKRLWFAYIFDQMNKKSYDINLTRYDRYNFDAYIKLTGWITERIITHLNNIEKKPKKKIYTANYNFLLLRTLFQALYNYLEILENDLPNLLGKDVRQYKSIYSFIGLFPDNFISENISTPDDLCQVINKVLKYYGFEDFLLYPDGILRYQDSTAESEEIKRAYRLLNEKKYSNVIQCLDDIFDIINSDLENKGNIGLDRCRYALESFYKRFLINHKIMKLYNGTETENGMINLLAETIRKNINNLFKFPKYSKNMDEGIKHLVEASKSLASGLADDGGAHGKSVLPKVQIDTVKTTLSFIILLINSLIPFEK